MKRPQTYKPYAAVWLILKKDNHVLLARRYNTGWMDGHYSLVSGHLEADETLTDAMIREAQEEANLSLTRDQLSVAHINHRKCPDREYIDFFFVAENLDHEPENLEPKKCDEFAWFPLGSLPENVVSNVAEVFRAIQNNQYYGELGW